METKFQVLEQAQPTRCEICHQADMFDPITESCVRCQALILTQTLPEQEAERYRRRQEAGLTVPRDTTVRASDIFRIIPEAFKLYRKNWPLFWAIMLIVTFVSELPRILFVLNDGSLGIETSIIFSIISLLTLLILNPLGMGALTKSILDTYRSEPTSLIDSYAFILKRGWRYLTTTALAGLYLVISLLPGIGIAMLGINFSQSNWLLMPLFCLIGFAIAILFGLRVYIRTLFISDVAIVEERYFSKAFCRSKELGYVNKNIILLFGVLSTLFAFVFQGIISSSFTLAGMVLLEVLQLTQPIFFVLMNTASSLLASAITPLLFATQLLLYFHIRMRTEEVKFTPENMKKSELHFQAPEINNV